VAEDPRQYVWACLFEDDACPSVPDAAVVPRMVEALLEAPSSVPYVQLGFCHDRHAAQARLGTHTWLGPAGWCCHAFAVRKCVAGLLADHIDAAMCTTPVDLAIASVVPNAMFVYAHPHRERVAVDTTGFGLFGQTFDTPSSVDQRAINTPYVRRTIRNIADAFSGKRKQNLAPATLQGRSGIMEQEL
jgi:hypothetical protein